MQIDDTAIDAFRSPLCCEYRKHVATDIHDANNVLFSWDNDVSTAQIVYLINKRVMANIDAVFFNDTIQQTSENSSTKEMSILNKIENRMFSFLEFPSAWRNEGVSEPNAASKEKANSICSVLFKKYDLYPDRIAPTKEGGIYIRYEHQELNCKRALIVEVYNDLEVAALINNDTDRSIVFTQDIFGMDFSHVIPKLKENPAPISASC